MSTATEGPMPDEPPTLTMRRAQGERSREEILEAAELLMSEKGYAATSISDLARTSGLPASSIYWHFGSKSGVLGAVMERGAHHWFRDVSRTMTFDDADPLARLTMMFRNSTAVIRAHPQFLRLFMILLLGSEGEHAQQDVVDRVRTEGKQKMRAGLAGVYAAWGPEVADAVAERLVDHAQAAFDGYFIATQADRGDSHPLLVEQMIESIHQLAEAVRRGGATAA